MRIKWSLLGFASLFIPLGFIVFYSASLADDTLPIGQIQGRGMISPYLDQKVTFRGIVTGSIEDQNTLGRRYYTIFAQDLQGFEDGDPLTSDGIAIFLGRDEPWVATGDIIYVTGNVTEYYGLTEIDDDGLWLTIESRNNPLPQPVELEPLVDMHDSEISFERLEGMFVSVPRAVTVGPTHTGCGFAVVRDDMNLQRVIRREINDPAGGIINVLNASDVDCTDLPALAVGDLVEGLAGPLTYHFDRYKIIQQNPDILKFSKVKRSVLFSNDIPLEPSQVSIASFNLDNYFDDVDDTGDIAEPKYDEVALAQKQAKLSATIAGVLSCPTLIGIQEVENEPLLEKLSEQLMFKCGFSYSISHLEAPDSRGSDLALLSDPRRVTFRSISQHQKCSNIETGVHDPSLHCPDGEEPLFSRPPLLVQVDIDGKPLSIFVNHFKSKRGGELETAPRRLAQARHILDLVSALNSPENDSAVIVLGDFNDYDNSALMRIFLDSGMLFDGLEEIPEAERYSYIFDGISQLVDWILVSPWLKDRIVSAQIVHVNADYPFQLGQSLVEGEITLRSSDHDIPLLVIDLAEDFQGDVKKQAIENSGENLVAELSPTSTITVPRDTGPDPTQSATTQDILADVDITPELSTEEGRLTQDKTTEDSQGEGKASQIRSEGFIPLIGLIILAVVLLVFLWLRRSGTKS